MIKKVLNIIDAIGDDHQMTSYETASTGYKYFRHEFNLSLIFSNKFKFFNITFLSKSIILSFS